jgi:hypothetical protein
MSPSRTEQSVVSGVRAGKIIDMQTDLGSARGYLGLARRSIENRLEKIDAEAMDLREQLKHLDG